MRLWLQSWCFSTLFMAVHTTIGAIDLWRLWMACISALLKLCTLWFESYGSDNFIFRIIIFFIVWVKNHLSEYTHLTFYIPIFCITSEKSKLWPTIKIPLTTCLHKRCSIGTKTLSLHTLVVVLFYKADCQEPQTWNYCHLFLQQ